VPQVIDLPPAALSFLFGKLLLDYFESRELSKFEFEVLCGKLFRSPEFDVRFICLSEVGLY
jgi:hypothetical protein